MRRRLMIPVLAAALLGLLPGTAVADHGGKEIGSLLDCQRPVNPPRCVSVGDNPWHYIYIDSSVPSYLAESVREAMTSVYGETVLVMREHSELLTFTDVAVYAGDHGANGAAGWAYCPVDAPQGVNARGDRWCRHQEIHFNLNARYAAFFADNASRVHLACHELGHTVGMRHWGNPPNSDGPVGATCMNADTPNGPPGLHPFDVDHLNAYYAITRPPRLCLSET